jgi:hypothetical protein
VKKSSSKPRIEIGNLKRQSKTKLQLEKFTTKKKGSEMVVEKDQTKTTKPGDGKFFRKIVRSKRHGWVRLQENSSKGA